MTKQQASLKKLIAWIQEQRGLTLEQLMGHKSKSTVTNLTKRAKPNPTLDTIVQIASAGKITEQQVVDALLARTDEHFSIQSDTLRTTLSNFEKLNPDYRQRAQELLDATRSMILRLLNEQEAQTKSRR